MNSTPVKRDNAPKYILTMVVSFAAMVVITRYYLELTGYPQMGGGELHIAHLLWGGLALFVASLLTNARMVIVPMSDHGTTRYSKCAKDIAHTYFLYPDTELDMSCVEAFRPVFVLPGDDLPPIPAEG